MRAGFPVVTSMAGRRGRSAPEPSGTPRSRGDHAIMSVVLPPAARRDEGMPGRPVPTRSYRDRNPAWRAGVSLPAGKGSLASRAEPGQALSVPLFERFLRRARLPADAGPAEGIAAGPAIPYRRP